MMANKGVKVYPVDNRRDMIIKGSGYIASAAVMCMAAYATKKIKEKLDESSFFSFLSNASEKDVFDGDIASDDEIEDIIKDM